MSLRFTQLVTCLVKFHTGDEPWELPLETAPPCSSLLTPEREARARGTLVLFFRLCSGLVTPNVFCWFSPRGLAERPREFISKTCGFRVVFHELTLAQLV